MERQNAAGRMDLAQPAFIRLFDNHGEQMK
jgi:hypothetical protein